MKDEYLKLMNDIINKTDVFINFLELKKQLNLNDSDLCEYLDDMIRDICVVRNITIQQCDKPIKYENSN